MSICQLASGLICLYQSLLLTGQLTSAQDSEIPSQQPQIRRNDQVWQVYGCLSLLLELLECPSVHLLYMRSLLETFVPALPGYCKLSLMHLFSSFDESSAVSRIVASPVWPLQH